MMQIFRHVLVYRFLCLLLISIFSLKTGGSVVTLKPSKYLLSFKVCADSEKEEKKESEKPFKSLDYLVTGESQAEWMTGSDLRATSQLHDCSYQMDHFGSVPSPPPDQMA
ncbi:hypothetical protein [Olivibacter sitiensis]|uniref:hypothetical protein n=1 Tax=Olivibacter sitiensis TaxID=376470 RepID=UPI0004886421|nr:hypothetical protein [Olivibacter sitiensis]